MRGARPGHGMRAFSDRRLALSGSDARSPAGRPCMSETIWRPMTAADLHAVQAVAGLVHPAYPEDEAVFAERLRLVPEGCHVLVDEEGLLLGYLVSHPWPVGAAPALNALLGEIPAGPANWYIHDLALLPEARGSGAARRIIAQVADSARRAGCTGLALVAVNDSAEFWLRHGFRPVDDPALAGKLASYDDAARYMRRELQD
jgi:GNAT superfamily N-acetyltransferase